jgi:hypothetical protein
MDLKQAEGQFHVLQSLHASGELAEETYRLEVAKLLWQDHGGSLWLIDADTGTWFRSTAEGWEPGDPHADIPPPAVQADDRKARRFPWGRLVAVSAVLLILAGLVALVLRQPWSDSPWRPPQSALPAGSDIQVAIASPADKSRVPLGQAVAIESTIEGIPDLEVVDHAELQINGQTVDTQSVRAKLRSGQTSFPLSQPWLPTSVGDYQVAVLVFSSQGDLVGTAIITLEVVETPDEALVDPECVPDATFVSDVTIPPGMAFPPGARMDKVWRVRNDGSCAWGVGYELVLQEGEDLGAPDAVPVPPTTAGETADLAVTYWAPSAPGSYASTWQLRSPDNVLFGPTLTLAIGVEILAEESQPPSAPTNLQATVAEDGESVWLVWEDQSDDEDAFRVYREDVEASIGLVPAGSELFVDEDIVCGNTYRYGVVAFNASGASPLSETAEVALPSCAPTGAPSGTLQPQPSDTPLAEPTDTPSASPMDATPAPRVDAAPTLTLTVVPTQVVASRPFTITFRAEDDQGVAQVVVWGVETGDPVLDQGRIFTCTKTICTGIWLLTPTHEISASWTIIGLAFDSSRQQSEPAEVLAVIRPPEPPAEEAPAGPDEGTPTPVEGSPTPTEVSPAPTKTSPAP